MGIERALRRTSNAKNFARGDFDKGSTVLVGSGFGIVLLLPIILDMVLGQGLLSLGIIEGSLALALMIFGLMMRVWAAKALGVYYTRTLLTVESQKVVDFGPYSKIRHPGYLGDLMQFSGFAVLTSNLILVVVLPVLFVAIYLYRISAEETMLIDKLGEDYRIYRNRTKKLVPLLY